MNRYALLLGLILILLTAPRVLAEQCKTVRDIHDFVRTWNDAVIGPGSRSHACTSLPTPASPAW